MRPHCCCLVETRAKKRVKNTLQTRLSGPTGEVAGAGAFPFARFGRATKKFGLQHHHGDVGDLGF